MYVLRGVKKEERERERERERGRERKKQSKKEREIKRASVNPRSGIRCKTFCLKKYRIKINLTDLAAILRNQTAMLKRVRDLIWNHFTKRLGSES